MSILATNCVVELSCHFFKLDEPIRNLTSKHTVDRFHGNKKKLGVLYTPAHGGV